MTDEERRLLALLADSARLDGWTALFLATTASTSVTAFFFPSTSFGPAHVVGVRSPTSGRRNCLTAF
jgi:hypothetical protein